MKKVNLNVELTFSDRINPADIQEVVNNVSEALATQSEDFGFEPDNSDAFVEKIEVGVAESKKFPNGFDSWMETHHEIVSVITMELAKDVVPEGVVGNRYEAQGTGGMYELAEELTDKFELMNEKRDWDGDFFDEIEAFIDEELYAKK